MHGFCFLRPGIPMLSLQILEMLSRNPITTISCLLIVDFILFKWKPQKLTGIGIRVGLFFAQLFCITVLITVSVLFQEKYSRWWIISLAIIFILGIWIFSILLFKRKNEELFVQNKISFDKFILYLNLGMIIFFIFRWRVINLVTIFGFLPLATCVGGMFLAASLWAFIYGIYFVREKGIRSLKMFALCVATLFAVLFVRVDYIDLYSDFWIFLYPREIVVQRIESGSFVAKDKFIALPWWGRALSCKEGEVEVIKNGKVTKVFFFNFLGVLSSFSGFVYCSDDQPPQSNDFGISQPQFRKMKRNWYLVSSQN